MRRRWSRRLQREYRSCEGTDRATELGERDALSNVEGSVGGGREGSGFGFGFSILSTILLCAGLSRNDGFGSVLCEEGRSEQRWQEGGRERAYELFALEESVVDLVLSFRDLWWRFLLEDGAGERGWESQGGGRDERSLRA